MEKRKNLYLRNLCESAIFDFHRLMIQCSEDGRGAETEGIPENTRNPKTDESLFLIQGEYHE